jgi:hypothetical protein
VSERGELSIASPRLNKVSLVEISGILEVEGGTKESSKEAAGLFMMCLALTYILFEIYAKCYDGHDR